jgi:hypothetical protein
VKTKTRASLKPVRLEIPDHWTPETAFAVFELINDLRDQIRSRYALDIQDALRRQLLPRDTDEAPMPPKDFCPAKSPDVDAMALYRPRHRRRIVPDLSRR